MTLSATTTWRLLLEDLLEQGEPTTQDSGGAEWRGRTSYEIIAATTRWPMTKPVVLCSGRKLGYRFMAADAAFILSGSNRLEEIAPFAPSIAKTSDEGVFLRGAYGPMYVDQLPYVVGALTRDQATRQAVSTIWRPRPELSKDIPCTLAIQFLIRPGDADRPTLHAVATMRSSDVWMGLPYDVHAFSMMAAHLALHLRPKLGPLALGDLFVTCGSQHLYKIDREPAEKCLWTGDTINGQRIRRHDELFPLAPLNLDEFARPQELVDHLWEIARRSDPDRLSSGWLKETVR